MISFAKTRFALITNGIVFVISLICFFGALFYLFRLNGEVLELSDNLNSERAAVNALGLLEQTINQNSDNINKIDSFFVSADEEADFIKQIETLASSTNVVLDINSFSHEAISGNQKFENAVLQGNIKGTFKDAEHFLMLLEVFPRAEIIRLVDFSVIPDDPKKIRQWKLAFVIKALKTK